MKHRHKYTLTREGNVAQMLCECGVNIKSILTDVTLISVESEDESGITVHEGVGVGTA